jgi:hypothetical protein
MELILMTNQIPTDEQIRAIEAAVHTIRQEIDLMPQPETSNDNRSEYFCHRLFELVPVEAIVAWVLDNRKEAAKRIDPFTCSWRVTFGDCTDLWCTAESCKCVGPDFVVWDDDSIGEIESHYLSPEQYGALRERIEREAKRPVLSGFSDTPEGIQIMPMPSSSDPERVTEQETP